MATQHNIPSTSCTLVTIRQLLERDLDSADRIFRLAFGTFLGMPDPTQFAGDSNCIHTRWRVDPAAAVAAKYDGKFVGSNLVTRWGSVGFFGPLTVEPVLWGEGIAKKMLAATMDILNDWQVTHAGLFTFSQSTKHISLYQRFDFWPRFLTMIMAKQVIESATSIQQLSHYGLEDRSQLVEQCRQVTDKIYPGLDLVREIHSVLDQRLGDVILLMEDSQVVGFAVCHSGARTEAGSGACYVKFAAVDSSYKAEPRFLKLLKSCEAFAVASGATRLIAGVNSSRAEAYRAMLGQGFRTEFQGVTMHRRNEAGYNRSGVYLIDDWR